MSQSSAQNIPGMDAMTDTLDFVKNLWGGISVPGMNMPKMGMPGMVMPTLSVEEINKQISDLKAVESWLTLNMNMLRGTIQALEVQSATISTLKSMGEALSAAVTPQPKKNPTPESRVEAKTPEPPASEPPAPEAAAPRAKSGGTASGAGSEPPLGNPAVWWNMLQDQFKQAVNTAMASEAAPAPSKPKSTPAPTPTPTPKEAAAKKPASKSAAKKPAAAKKRKPAPTDE